MRYKVHDIVVTTADCNPSRWQNKVVLITGAPSDYYYMVADGNESAGMFGHEIARPATDEEILLFKLTL